MVCSHLQSILIELVVQLSHTKGESNNANWVGNTVDCWKSRTN